VSKGDLPTRTSQVIARPPRRQAKPADPCAMVIFGAGGDLTGAGTVQSLAHQCASREICVDRLTIDVTSKP
jgi:glucose-6-phosphate 1-dehydrogenase